MVPRNGAERNYNGLTPQTIRVPTRIAEMRRDSGRGRDKSSGVESHKVTSRRLEAPARPPVFESTKCDFMTFDWLKGGEHGAKGITFLILRGEAPCSPSIPSPSKTRSPKRSR
ncbi:hypothetical protein FTUN_5704 [Frigoriglobus tundricola]|uniref:Uncharacterized protein n=1 Tax=Frigoriglobus tundricola TaxID=2774151 RepID=A0A6M5YXD4_9BACT|nr:hypothetical protein FTUN_5704 [Frigoriglobus tundricola]